MERAHNVGEGADRAELSRTIMRRQARLGLRIAAVFVLILIGLPLLNLTQPELMATRIGGFSLTWLTLAVLFYPVTWLLSWLFVRGSDQIEAAIVQELRGDGLQTIAPLGTLSSSPVEALGTAEGLPRGDQEGAPRKKKLFVEDEE